MSGTALGFLADRMTENEMFRVYGISQNFISHFSNDYWIDIVPYYKTKESFGDLDIVVKMKNADWCKLVENVNGTFEHFNKNGNVLSFGVKLGSKIHQVDLIYTGESEMQHRAALDYFSFNDLGNLVGRIAHRMGFKYGHRGLNYILRDSENSSQVISDLSISKDSRKIYEFLDLDYNRFLRGFCTREEIFEFVASSKFFHPDIYLFENVNAVSRIRDKKRETYNKFLEWCKVQQFIGKFSLNERQKAAFRKVKIIEAIKFFGVEDEYHRNIEQYNVVELSKTLFNGNIVTDITGAKGKELGELMKYLKEHHQFNDHRFIVESISSIEDIVKISYEKYQNIKNE